MKALHIFIVVCLLLAVLPTRMRLNGQFTNYAVCPHSERFGRVYPTGTFVLKQAAANELCRILRNVHQICVELGIPYTISAGTLLGHQRHDKQIIPFDDDIDICIFSSFSQDDFQRLLHPDFTLVRFMGWWKVISRNMHIGDRWAISLDMFDMRPDGTTARSPNEYCR